MQKDIWLQKEFINFLRKEESEKGGKLESEKVVKLESRENKIVIT
jgi:hypothetical protein